MNNPLVSLVDMNKYQLLLNGVGNPSLSLVACTEGGHCAWSSTGDLPEPDIQKAIGLEIGQLLSDELSPSILHTAHTGFTTTVLHIPEENRAKLVALALVEEFPHEQNTVSAAGLDARQSGQFLAAIKTLLLDEIRLTSVALVRSNQLEKGGAEVLLLNAVDQLVRRHLAEHGSVTMEETLQSVLDECAARLPVDRAMLYLKAENLLLSAPSAGQDDAVATPLLRMMRKDILLFETNAPDARVRMGTPVSSSPGDGQPADDVQDFLASHDRLLVCIPDALGRVIGMLSFVKRKSTSTPFSQTEHRLIELLERSVNQVVSADFDDATGFLNATGFFPKLGDMLRSEDYAGADACMLHIRFGQLISIGDTCGSDALDQAVVQLGAILEKRIRKRDLAARSGSSDFLLYLNKCSTKDAEALCEALLDTLKGYRFSYKDKLFSINAYIGVVPLENTERDISSLVDAGEAACAEAMSQGMNGYSVYEPRQKVAVRNNGLIDWSDRIVETLRDEKLHLYSQPVVALNSLDLVDHHEVLLRVKSDNALLVAPSVFVRVAERNRLIEQVDQWVIKNSFARLNQVYSVNPDSRLALSINVSGATLNESFPQFVAELMEDMVFPASAIIFELTEASAVSNMRFIVKAVRTMRRDGFRFSLDDFGAGMGSFAFLQNLAVDRLTIDGALIRGITRGDVNYAIVEAIQSVSRQMSLQTTAKLVDAPAILDKLSGIGVDFIQGHLVAKAAPIDQLVASAAQKNYGIPGGV